MLFDIEALNKAISGLKSLGVGIGWSINDDYKKIIEYLLLYYSNFLVIDADGINVLSKMDLGLLNKASCKIVLTPHLKEFSRLTGYSIEYIVENTIYVVLEFTRKYNVTLLLKGPTSLIAKGKNINFVNRGCSGMATAGSGDVLTGILVGMLGYIDDEFLATSLASYINGYAGELAMEEYSDISMTSSDTASMIKKAIKNIIVSISPQK